MKNLNSETVSKPTLPIKILQFGEGNFLRAFADWMIDKMNTDHGYNSGVAVVQPIAHGMVQELQDQSCMYHHIMRGLESGDAYSETRLIRCIQEAINPFEDPEAYFEIAISNDLEIVISNTTEAGIVFDDSDLLRDDQLPGAFPGKVTQLLWKRFNRFDGAADKGLKFIPVELIEKNGKKLKEAILKYANLWALPGAFSDWVQKHNYFANTLVDRIVPGFPKDEIDTIKANLNFDDNLVVSSELFYLWVMDAPQEIQEAFPADKCGLNVIYTDNVALYRTRKVRILNGAHTSMVPVGLLNGIETVRESMEDPAVGAFVRHIIFSEIAPTIDLPEEELKDFANEVLDRFRNPFIHHELRSISLNSISKYKVRVLPSLLDYVKMKGLLPFGLTLALAHLIKLYLSDTFEIRDNNDVIEYFNGIKSKSLPEDELAKEVLGKQDFWESDLNQVHGLPGLLSNQLHLLNAGKNINDFTSELV